MHGKHLKRKNHSNRKHYLPEKIFNIFLLQLQTILFTAQQSYFEMFVELCEKEFFHQRPLLEQALPIYRQKRFITLLDLKMAHRRVQKSISNRKKFKGCKSALKNQGNYI